ncbi:sensor histidine kinase [Paenibacillus sp. N3.4]|uniref:cache domain-containing sensor histidine kinase n=1 Tax=Paenibacillus sp. N3.4 TaxID=2603222 RepID=UPI0011C9F0FB|nr:sensor histidine kinase [Paenibacillus sp. N3.4]TXK82609.1 sensor histidine kinase [Paenibacillus sp. N3.4]
MTRNPFKKYRIDYLYFTAFAGIILLLIVSSTWLSVRYMTRQNEDNAAYYQQRLLHETNKQLDLLARSMDQQSLNISRNSDLQDVITGRNTDPIKIRLLLDWLSDQVYSTSEIHSIYIYSDRPAYTGATSPIQFKSLQETDPDTQLMLTTIEHAESAWTPEHTLIRYEQKKQVVSINRKIYLNSGQFIGVLTLNVDAEAIRGLMSEPSNPANRNLLDSGGRFLMATSNFDQGVVSLTQNLLARNPELSNGKLKMNTDKDVSVFVVWERSFTTGWVLLELTPWSEMKQGTGDIVRVLVWIGLVVMIIAMGVTLLISRQFTKPLRKMTQLMSKFDLERETIKVPNDYSNEFGHVFRGYNRLTERILQLVHELEDQHKLQRETEVRALQAMINPHFLYNTLDQINWMAIEARQNEISRALALLGKMLRIGLSNGATLIHIHEEIAHIECYLGIQNIRWDNQLQYTIEVDPTCSDLYIPKMTLQPLVENAVVHGFNGQTSGHIQIVVKQEVGDVWIRISDNGAGLRNGWEDARPRTRGGYGLRNVRERLKSLFGSEYTVQLESGASGGTHAIVHIPVISSTN